MDNEENRRSQELDQASEIEMWGQEERPARPRRPVSEEVTEEQPVRRRRPVSEDGTEEQPVRRRRPVSEDGTEEQPVRRRRPVSEDGAEEQPVRRRRPVSEDKAEEQPVRRRRPVSEDKAEEQPVRRRRPVSEDEAEEQPIRRRRPVSEDEAEERPIRRRRSVSEDGTEEQPVRRRRPMTGEEFSEHQTRSQGGNEASVRRSRPHSDEAAAGREPFTRSGDRQRPAAKPDMETDRPDERKRRPKKKKGLLVFLSILLVLFIAMLGVCIWQMKVVQDGGDSFFNSILNHFSSADVPPSILPSKDTDAADNNASGASADEPSAEADTVDANTAEADTAEDMTDGAEASKPQTAESVQQTSPTEPQTYQNDANGNLIIPERQPGSMETEPAWESVLAATGDDTLDTANRQAAMYDYDAAIATLQAVAGYESNQAYTDAIADYEQRKSQAVRYADNSTIPHIFFHTLAVDTSRCFDESIAISREDGVCKVNAYNYVMTTVDEFCRIMEEMYNRGYVLVSIYDIAAYETAEDGTQVMKHQPIYLPEGKKPFVLSVDDVSYYQYMEGHGFASKLVIGEDGKVTNEYVMPDGSVVYGSYDVMPILEDFIETHPDFSYRGAKGIIALTGYNGILGYRTCDYWYDWDCPYFDYSNEKHVAERQRLYADNPNIEQDKETAKQVAEAIKAQGWLFASHTWGHNLVGDSNSYEFIKWDTEMWEREVEPLLGDTDIIIFPQGEDLYAGSWRGYDPANEKYQLFKSVGFDYFCNVDSNLGWTQLGTDYFRMGRANVDGQRMWEALTYYQNPNNEEGAVDRLSALFDSRLVFDWSRPTPVVK